MTDTTDTTDTLASILETTLDETIDREDISASYDFEIGDDTVTLNIEIQPTLADIDSGSWVLGFWAGELSVVIPLGEVGEIIDHRTSDDRTTIYFTNTETNLPGKGWPAGSSGPEDCHYGYNVDEVRILPADAAAEIARDEDVL